MMSYFMYIYSCVIFESSKGDARWEPYNSKLTAERWLDFIHEQLSQWVPRFKSAPRENPKKALLTTTGERS